MTVVSSAKGALVNIKDHSRMLGKPMMLSLEEQVVECCLKKKGKKKDSSQQERQETEEPSLEATLEPYCAKTAYSFCSEPLIPMTPKASVHQKYLLLDCFQGQHSAKVPNTKAFPSGPCHKLDSVCSVQNH